jgi:hypothetical protein
MSFQVARDGSPLVEPWTWKTNPGALHDQLAALRVAAEASDTLHRNDLNARLARLGFTGNPIKPLSAVRSSPREHGAVEVEIPPDGRRLIRPATGTVLRVR